MRFQRNVGIAVLWKRVRMQGRFILFYHPIQVFDLKIAYKFIIYRKKSKVKHVTNVKKGISVCRQVIQQAALIVTALACPPFAVKLLDIDCIRYVFNFIHRGIVTYFMNFDTNWVLREGIL